MKKFLSIILAVVMIASLLPATFVSAADGDTAVVHEYKINLDSFNYSDLPTVSGADAAAPNLRGGTLLYYQAAMNYWTTIPGTQTKSGNPIDPFFNEAASDKWGLVQCTFKRSGARLGTAHLFAEHTKSAGANLTFKIVVDQPGEYFLQTTVGKEPGANYDVPKTAVYFFKDGTEGVTNTNYNTFPTASKLGYFYPVVGQYATIAKVNVPAAGEYIVSYVCDNTTSSMFAADADAIQLSIGGIKLVPTAGETITGAEIKLADTSVLANKKTSLSMYETGSVSGIMRADASDYTFSASPAGMVTIAADGKISAHQGGNVTITATKKENPEITAQATLEIIPNLPAQEHTYVFSKAGFNTDKMITTADYSGKPVIRSANNSMYLAAMFDWKYEVPATYSSTEPQAAFMALDTTTADGDKKLTDKWAFATYNQTLGAAFVSDSGLRIQANSKSYTSNPTVVAIRLNIEAAGTYTLKVKSGSNANGVSMATYFTKETAGANYKTTAAYASATALGRFNSYEATDYVNLGTITVAEPGNYILGFATDATTSTLNADNIVTENANTYQWFQLESVKLLPAEYNYVFAHTAHASSALNGPLTPGYVPDGTDIRKGTNFVDVGFADTDYTVSSGAWGNLDIRPESPAVALRSGLTIHRTGDFVHLTNLAVPIVDGETTTYGFIDYNSIPGGMTTYPTIIIGIDVPYASRYNPSFTISNSAAGGQKFDIFLVKYQKSYDSVEAWEIRGMLNPADRIGSIDSSVGGTQALEEIYLQDSPYFLILIPSGAGKNSNASSFKASSEITLQLKKFTLTAVDSATPKSQALLDREAAALVDEGNPDAETLEDKSATINVLARAVGTDEDDDDIADVIDTETVVAGETYTTPAAPEIEGYKFLYWGRGIGTNMRPISTDETATFKASQGANYIAAFYSKVDATDAVVEFYNANGELVDRRRYEDGKEIDIPALPSLTGVGTAKGWTDDAGETEIGTDAVVYADGPIMAFFAVYDEEAIAENITITASGSTGITGAGTYAFGDVVTLAAPKFENGNGYNMFLYWKKNGEIVSFDREYIFNAAVSCNVEAVYAKYGPTSVEALRKIIVSTVGETVVAEFIGCKNALERGLVFDTPEGQYKKAMTTNETSFSMINDIPGAIAKAYAIFADGVIFSK